MSLQKARKARDERAEIVEKMRALSDKAGDESRDLTEDEQREWDRMDDEQESLRKRADRYERAHDLEQETDESTRDRRAGTDDRSGGGADDDRSDRRDSPETAEQRAARIESERAAYREWVRFGMAGLSAEERALMRMATPPPEARAQSTTTTAGGYTIPEGFQRELEVAMLAFGGMREAARIVPTDSGNDLPWPTTDDTGNTGALIAENVADTEQDVTFGQLVLGAFGYTSKIVRVSVELLQDSAFDMEDLLRQLFGERIGRITNTHFTTGDGSSKPQGATVAATLGVTAASATAITHDELLDLKHSVNRAYRRNPSVRFMFADTTLKAVKKLKDSTGRPLWASGIATREPDTIDGDQFVINDDIPAMTTGLRSVLYGDFRKYIIRDVRPFSMVRLVERYAEFRQVGFIGFSRHDGDLVDAGTAPLKYLAQA